jgi:hypothetical protein
MLHRTVACRIALVWLANAIKQLAPLKACGQSAQPIEGCQQVGGG